MDRNKEIGGVSIEKWKRAFADAVNIAIDKDYFSDTLSFELYPTTDEDYEKLWDYVDEAFEEVFGCKRNNFD